MKALFISCAIIVLFGGMLSVRSMIVWNMNGYDYPIADWSIAPASIVGYYFGWIMISIASLTLAIALLMQYLKQRIDRSKS